MRLLWLLFGMSFSVLIGGLFYSLMMLAPEASQGFAQKIFFIHVPSAFAMYIGIIGGAIMGVVYLIEKKPDYDHWSRAFMLSGLIFAAIVMTTGPVWAKPIWGAYWTWDPRLTTTLLLTLILCGYHVLRSVFEQKNQLNIGRTTGAIVAIIASIDIPLIHYSVRLWRGIHPQVIQNPNGLPQDYRNALQVMILGILVLSILITLIFHRYLRIREAIQKELPHA